MQTPDSLRQLPATLIVALVIAVCGLLLSSDLGVWLEIALLDGVMR